MKWAWLLAMVCGCGASSSQLAPSLLAHSGDGRRVLLVVTSNGKMGQTGLDTGYWLGEVAHFYVDLTRLGYQVDFVSPLGGKPPLDERSRDAGDRDNQTFLADRAAQERFDHTLVPSAVRAEDYAAIYFAGGHGPMWDLPDHAELGALTRAIWERGGAVAAVCHGPAGLLNVKLSDGKLLIAGKRVTGLSNTEELLSGHRKHVPFQLENALKERGALYRSGAAFGVHVEVDDRLVTGQNPRSTHAVAAELAALLYRLKR